MLCSLLVNGDTQIGFKMPRLSSSGAVVCSGAGVTAASGVCGWGGKQKSRSSVSYLQHTETFASCCRRGGTSKARLKERKQKSKTWSSHFEVEQHPLIHGLKTMSTLTHTIHTLLRMIEWYSQDLLRFTWSVTSLCGGFFLKCGAPIILAWSAFLKLVILLK